MPGSGKTTFGRKIAQELYRVFIDLDREIEKSSGKTIPEIFSQQGESAFREIEKNCLRDIVARHDKFLLATGGGAPCFHDNMEFMKQNGLVVFLNQSVDYIVGRVLRKKHKRPMIEKLDDSEVQSEIAQMHKKRLPFYQEAHVVLDHDDIDINSAMEKLYMYDN